MENEEGRMMNEETKFCGVSQKVSSFCILHFSFAL